MTESQTQDWPDLSAILSNSTDLEDRWKIGAIESLTPHRKFSAPIHYPNIKFNVPLYHDALNPLTSQNLSYSTSAGTAVSTTAFASTTQYIQACAPGVASLNGGVRIAVGKAPVASATSIFLPFNWIQIIQVPAGSQLSS